MKIFRTKWFNILICLLIILMLAMRIIDERKKLITSYRESSHYNIYEIDKWDYIYEYGILYESPDNVKEAVYANLDNVYSKGIMSNENYEYILQMLNGGFKITGYLEKHNDDEREHLFDELREVMDVYSLGVGWMDWRMFYGESAIIYDEYHCSNSFSIRYKTWDLRD